MDNNQILNQTQNPTQENESAISLKDLVFIVLNNWYWFVISVFVCLVVTAFVYKSKPKTYTDNATILLRDESGNKGYKGQNMDAIFATMGMGNSGLTLENEIYIIKSTPLLMKTAERLGMNSWCNRNDMFKKVSYYTDSPMRLKVYNKQVDSVKLTMTMEVTPIDENSFNYRLTSLNGHRVKGEKKKATFDQIVNVNDYAGFSVEKLESFRADRDLDVTFNMGFTPLYDIARGMRGRLDVSRADKVDSILNISYSDANAVRAREVVDTLIAVYNEDVINDKNMVAEKTEKFIDDRIALIFGELSAVDARIESLQKSANVPDLSSASGTVLQSGMRYADEVAQLEVELAAIGLNHLLKLAYSSISRYGEELIDCVRQLISSNLDRLNFERIRRCDGQVQIYDRVATVHILAQQLVRRTFGISLGKLLSAELIYLTVADGSILDAVFGSGAGSDGESYDTVTSFRSILGEALVGAVCACYRQVFRLDGIFAAHH